MLELAWYVPLDRPAWWAGLLIVDLARCTVMALIYNDLSRLRREGATRVTNC